MSHSFLNTRAHRRRHRIKSAMLHFIREEAMHCQLYVPRQLCIFFGKAINADEPVSYAFIKTMINDLLDSGEVKLTNKIQPYCDDPKLSHLFFLCVRQMYVRAGILAGTHKHTIDPDRWMIAYPTHYKKYGSKQIIKMKNPRVWTLPQVSSRD